MYDANIVLCIYILKFNFKLKFKEILKYEFVIMYFQYMFFLGKSNVSLQQIK